MEKSVKVKICGLTRPEEVAYVNEAGVDYGGFVFYGPSKRNISIPRAVELRKLLHPRIQSVAVTVSPEAALAQNLERAGFAILQVHKELSPEVLEAVHIPVWYAVNLTDPAKLQEKVRFLEMFPPELSGKVKGIVVDAGDFGSGKTFAWGKETGQIKKQEILKNRRFILAGGLNPSNVKEGIRLFGPDVVDVSSGVEGTLGKDKKLVREFTERVKNDE